MENDLCPVIARLLAYMYCSQSCRIRWGNNLSSNFDILNGVKQGGVLSPNLFNQYIDVLLKRMMHSGVGCYIGKTFAGSLSYADDVLILSPSIKGMKTLLDICEQFSEQYDILFNASKSKLIVFGESNLIPRVELQGQLIPVVDKENHLGYPIGNRPRMNECIIYDAINDLFLKLNAILCQFPRANPDIQYYLFKVYCTSLYGSQLWNYEDKYADRLNVVWRKCVRRIYKLSPRTHCALLPLICKDQCLITQLNMRFLKFIQSASKSKNKLVSLCSKLIISGSKSKACYSYNYICCKYGLDRFSAMEEDVKVIKCAISIVQNDEELLVAVGAIRDFIYMRHYQMADANHLNDILDILCTF